MSNSLLFSLNSEGKVYALSTNGTCWREFMYLGLEFKTLSAVPHYLWAVGGDRQIYLHVHGLEIPIRVKEESYENERWLPLEGFSGRLLPTDRYQFSSQDGTKDRTISNIRLPSMAWQWEGDWQLELTLDGEPLDHDGWSYAVDFPAQFYPNKQWKSCVRRRKWIRYRKFSAMNSWCAIAPLHKDPTQEPFIDVSIGGNYIPHAPSGTLLVWSITAQGRVMFRTGVTIVSPEGQKWISVSSPPNCDVKQISVGSSGLVWAILWSGRAIVRKGITKDCLIGEAWLEVKSPNNAHLCQVSVGFNTVWAMSSDHKVWFRKGIDGNLAGTHETAALGSGWLEVTGNMSHVSVGINDQVFAIGETDKCIYWRSGITASELTGKRWRMIQANMQLSRTSSTASGLSSNSNAKHSSLLILNETVGESKSNACMPDSWEESHSAPIEHTLPLKSKGKSHNRNAVGDNIDLSGKSYETTLKNPRAWSPVRSVGSVVGMEAHPDTDSSAFDIDVGLYYDEEVSQAAWGTCDAVWSFVDAGACNLDILQIPQWFNDNQSLTNTYLQAIWRMEILEKLKSNKIFNQLDPTTYTLAVEEKGWTRGCEVHLINNKIPEESILSFYWHSSDNTGTLSVFHPDGTIKFILNLNDLTSVCSSSEPGCPRITLTAPAQYKDPITIQYISELEQEEWLNIIVDIIYQIHGFFERPSADSVWAITNLGDIINWDPECSKLNFNETGGHIKELKVIGNETLGGFTSALNNNFPYGSTLSIHGCLMDEIKRFEINLQGAEIIKQRHKIKTEIADVPFHLNVRYDENCVVCNSKTNGTWGLEERHEIPIDLSQCFTIKIFCMLEGFTIKVNNNFFCFFKHRISPINIASVRIKGPMKLHKLEYKTDGLIISSDEMIWRMMGGYLKRIETCQSEVVWGIAHDHRAWVYTGSWGGGIIKGVGNKDGLHSMTDTLTYCVYENQRWNPLSGYISTGLPTDRHMWSDITGKHKRTREHTKLINRHFHWISEWMIDYNTPGEVDGDGWQYATDFPATYHGKKVFTDCVRRRRWYRKAQHVAEGPWCRAGSTPILDISLWAKESEITVWAITLSGEAICRLGVTSDVPVGTQWEHVNSPQSFIAISTCDDIVWTVGRRGELYYRDGITHDCPTGSKWRLIEPPKFSTYSHKSATGVKAVSLTKNAAWVILANGSVAVRTEVSPDKPNGKQWKYLTDSEKTFKHVSAGEREVWSISSEGHLFRRLGISDDNKAGTAWQQLLNISLSHVSARGLKV